MSHILLHSHNKFLYIFNNVYIYIFLTTICQIYVTSRRPHNNNTAGDESEDPQNMLVFAIYMNVKLVGGAHDSGRLELTCTTHAPI